MLEKFNRMTLLQDFYGRLLTPRQQRFFELYYDQNLSLGEIAEEHQISRQAVYDLLRRTEKSLEDYETRLGLVDKFAQDREKLQEALSWLRTLPRDGRTETAIERVNQILYDIIGLEDDSEVSPPATNTYKSETDD